MAGYQANCSMSNNAVRAYKEGKKPLSKWKKADILQELKLCLGENTPQFRLLKAVPLEALKSNVLISNEWHHTSGHYNRTDFYEFDEKAALHATLSDIKGWIECHRKKHAKKNKVSPKRRGTIHYIEWDEAGIIGKKNVPIKKKLSGVWIEKKGCFYRVYDDENNLILRKNEFRRYKCAIQ